MDEVFDCWTVAKIYSIITCMFDRMVKTDERDAIMRDRNHPNVSCYSVGNEIHDTTSGQGEENSLRPGLPLH